MTFLQPWLLWGLPLALLPVIIHLLNRLRHRSIPWAAMIFLRTATRKSTRHARLRQWLILLLRVLAVITLVLAISRPLSGGWGGGLFSSAPDVIVLALDRSASMETRSGGTTRRQQALDLFVAAAQKFEQTSRLVLLDSASRAPQEVTRAALLPQLSLTGPTDTAADLPSILQSALDWLAQDRPGSAEIWIASDLQASNWQPADERWAALCSAMARLPQRVRIRLLASNPDPIANSSVAVRQAIRRQTSQGSELELTVDLEQQGRASATLPLTVNLQGAPSQIEVKMDSASVRYRHRIPLPPEQNGGWGYVEIPADANLRDNRSYFVYGPVPTLRAAVVSADPPSGRILQVAAAPVPSNTNQLCRILEPAAATTNHFDQFNLVLWQAAIPLGDTAQRLRQFVDRGGTLVFFPAEGPAQFESLQWGPTQTNSAAEGFRVNRWDERDGPLAKTEEGLSLPLPEMAVTIRKAILGDCVRLASFEDGAPFLGRKLLGRGEVLFCATLPREDWSQLGDGPVLVPMLQRLLETSARHQMVPQNADCGVAVIASNERAEGVSPEARDVRTQAGVYRLSNKLLAVNLPERELNPESLEAPAAKALFGSLPVQLFQDKTGASRRLESELWRLFLFVMLLVLVGEAILILPSHELAEGVNPVPSDKLVSSDSGIVKPAHADGGVLR